MDQQEQINDQVQISGLLDELKAHKEWYGLRVKECYNAEIWLKARGLKNGKTINTIRIRATRTKAALEYIRRFEEGYRKQGWHGTVSNWFDRTRQSYLRSVEEGTASDRG